ncbi:MAG: carboxypeptidase-like regulatory domain-containing protein [Acidobacteria bacterium]|nr:carboxypeptidase-like regulatory domain-containing protein [Acidobacteriota bacterium]
MYRVGTLLRLYCDAMVIGWLGCLLASSAAAGFAQTIQTGASVSSAAVGIQNAARATPANTPVSVRGRLVSADTSAPVANVSFELRPAIPGNKAQVFSGSTDASGMFQFTAMPGRYILSTPEPGCSEKTIGRRIGEPIIVSRDSARGVMEVRLHRLGTVEGDITGPDNLPLVGATVTLSQHRTERGRRMLVPQRAASTDGRGHFVLFDVPSGGYLLSAVLRPPAQAGNAARALAHTYFPGVAAAASASPIQVAQGQQVQGLRLQLKQPANLTISGTVTGLTGSKAAGFTVTAVQEPTADGVVFLDRVVQKTDTQGNFRISGLAPGRYRLLVKGNPKGRNYGATKAVELFNADLANVSIVVGAGAQITGKITFEGNSYLLSPRIVQLALKPELELGAITKASVQADSTFAITGIPEGPARFTVTLPTNRAYVKAIRLNGRDVADQAVSFANGDRISGVEVLLSFDGARLTGTLQAGANALDNAAVVVFPTSRDLWQTSPRLIKVAYPSSARAFTASGIMPGEYGVVALNNVAIANGIDSVSLAAIEPLAKKIKLSAREIHTETLPVAAAPSGWR